MLTDDARYDALVARDARWDGVFFVGVSTTGIYCRPICPARTPGRTRCTFYETPVQAERAGFRACFRCRPELAPGNALPGRQANVDAVDKLVQTAAARINEGALNDGSVDELAKQLGVSSRHLRRTMEAKLGVTPIELAQTRRLALAKQLLHDTSLSLTEIAFAAGFGSIRRFNAVFLDVMGRSPSELRRKHIDAPQHDALVLRLDYRAPYDFDGILKFLAARAIPGVEHVETGRYRRVVHLDKHVGIIEVRHAKSRAALELAVAPSLVAVLMPLVARVRRMFDLDARPDVIGRVLSRDRMFAPLVAANPGLRVPGAIDGFEAAVRAMLGQQVSVAAATTLAGRFAATFGTPLATSISHARVPEIGRRGAKAQSKKVDRADGELVARLAPAREVARLATAREVATPDVASRVEPLAFRFPTAREVAKLSVDAIAKIGLPGARAAAVHALAVAVANGDLDLEARDLDVFVERAVAMPGIGPWTAHYLAMRTLHLPDAFPAADLGVKKALAGASPREAEARAEAWRPFRSYAVMYLWTSLGGKNVEEDDREVTGRRTDARRQRERARSAVPPRVRRTAAGGRQRQDAAARARRRSARRILRG